MDSDSIKCTQCTKSFDKKGKLTAHVKTVHSGIKYECDFCEKQYGSKQGLNAHKKTIHKEELQNSENKEIEEKVGFSINQQSSRSQNNDVATSLLKTEASTTKTDDQVDNAMKSNVVKKVPAHKEKKSAKTDPKIKEKSSSKETEKGIKKKTVSLTSNVKHDNEFHVNDKQDKSMEKELLNKVNPDIKFDFDSLESQNRMEIKAKEDVSKENPSHLLKDQLNLLPLSSFASDCQIKHEDCQDKDFNKPYETMQTEVEDDAEESCLWAHCDNLVVEEELNVQSHLDNKEIRPKNATLTDDHSEEKVLELQASKENNLKQSEEVEFNTSSDTPQNVTSGSPLNGSEKSLESSSFPKKDNKPAVSLETTPEVVDEFVCETIGCKKKFTAKGDLDDHMRSADGQNRKCINCLKDFFNEECHKYHKDQNCGVDSESDEEGDDDDDSDFDEEGEEEWDEDEVLDGPEHEREGLSNEPEKVKDTDNKLDVYDDVKETDVDKETVLKPLDQRKPNKLVENELNDINVATDRERNDTLDKVETKDVSASSNAFIQSSPSSVQPKSDSQAPTQNAETNDAQIPSKDTIETRQNNVQYPIENATQMTTNDVQRHTINDNQKPANDIKHPAKNGNQGPANDAKEPIENSNRVSEIDIKNPTENVREAFSTDNQHPSGTNLKQNADQIQNIRPVIEAEDRTKAPKEITFSLKEKQLLYRHHQQWKGSQYFKPLPYSPEQIIQMSQAQFDNISAYLTPSQIHFCKFIRDMFMKLRSKPAPSNILQEKQPADNSMQNKTIPKQMLKRKVEPVSNESMSKKIHLETKAAKEEFEDPNLKIQQSVLKGLNLGNNKENYEVIIEDGKVKLRIIGNHNSSSESLDEDIDEASGQDDSKWKTHSDCKKNRAFSNGGPTIPDGWKMCFKEQTMEGRKVMVAKYMDPQGKFYNRGPNGYDEMPNF